MALTLGIETSCDETSVAVVDGGRRVLSNVIHSQVDLHKEFGGVVPELAARDHLERLPHLLDLALEKAGVQPPDIDLLAVTRGQLGDYAPEFLVQVDLGVDDVRQDAPAVLDDCDGCLVAACLDAQR